MGDWGVGCDMLGNGGGVEGCLVGQHGGRWEGGKNCSGWNRDAKVGAGCRLYGC